MPPRHHLDLPLTLDAAEEESEDDEVSPADRSTRRFDRVDASQRQLKAMLESLEAKLDIICNQIASRPSDGLCGTRGQHNVFASATEGPSSRELAFNEQLGGGRLGQVPWQVQAACDLEEAGGRDDTCSEGEPFLAIRPGFDVVASSRRSSHCTHSNSSTASLVRWRTRNSVHSRDSMMQDPSRVRHAWNPDSLSRTLFEATSMFMLLYDAFVMPYRLAWYQSEEEAAVDALSVSMWITRIFWTIDLPLSLVTGFRDKEAKLELRLGAAMQHYLQTWFFPDLALVSCDWLTLLTLSGLQSMRWIRGMQVMRLVRGGRQVVRAWTLVLKAKIMIPMRGLHLAMDISLLLLAILWVNHVVCCGWYFIGRQEDSDTGSTWLSSTEYSLAGRLYEYSTALHWAITQMTPGSMEVVPVSSMERIYTVLTLFFGLLLGSSLIATITSMMTQYKLEIEASSRKFMQLQQYLGQQGVDPELAMAIKLQVKARSKERQRLKMKDVEYLSLVSNTMQEALWHSCCMKYISGHTFLNSLNLCDAFAVQSICNNAIRGMESAAGDAIFEEGATGYCMYFLAHGHLRYNPGESSPEHHLPEIDDRLNLKCGDWCSEPALWTLWTHLGTLEAVSTSEVLRVQATSLHGALCRFPAAWAILVDYCTTFHKYINESGVLRSDLAHVLDNNELISGLSQDTREQLAEPVIQKLLLESRFWGHILSQCDIHLLRDEVASGKCHIGFVGAEAVRNTFVVALRLTEPRAGSRFLVKVGEVLRNGEVVPYCLLPGVKRKWRETYKSAVQRLLEFDLGEISSLVETHFSEGFEQAVAMYPSPTYGIRTRYLRTTFRAGFTSEPKLATVTAPPASVQMAPLRRGRLAELLRPAARFEAEKQERVLDVLTSSKSVVVLRCNGDNRASRKLYMWLTSEEFDILSEEPAKPAIKQWLLSLECTQLDDIQSSAVALSQQVAFTEPGCPEAGSLVSTSTTLSTL